MMSHFLQSLGNYTRRAIFPETCKINQSSVDFHCGTFGWLFDWWEVDFGLIGLLDSYRPIWFYGDGANVTQHKGVIQWQWRSVLCYREKYREPPQQPAMILRSRPVSWVRHAPRRRYMTVPCSMKRERKTWVSFWKKEHGEKCFFFSSLEWKTKSEMKE